MNNILDTIETAGIFSKLNDEQAAAVLAENNTAVSAGAGSGKTTVLACRFAHLVLNRNISADRILTLTFTKKAAAEMYGRIYGTLREVSEKGSGEAKERASAALSCFFRAHIQTIDSYSASIVRLAAHRYGVRPDFQPDEETAAQAADETALQFLLEHRSAPALQMFMKSSSPELLAHELFALPVCRYSLINEPAPFEQSIPIQFKKLFAAWAQNAEKAISLIGRIVSTANGTQLKGKFGGRIAAFIQMYNDKREDIEGQDMLALQQYFDSILDAPPGGRYIQASKPHISGQMTRLLNIVTAVPKKDGRVKSAPELNELLEQFQTFKDTLPSIAASIIQAGAAADIMNLLEQFQQQYLAWKRASGCLSFADTAALAVSVLRDQSDIRQNEKNAFDAVMIDEFQDNNSMQRDLLYLLAEKPDRLCTGKIPEAQDLCPGKLFFVGDEKQSIYKFRGADVSVFRNLTEGLCGSQGSGTALQLRTNYRSRASLIRAFNLMFGGSLSMDNTDSPPEATLPSSIFLKPDGRTALPDYEAACGQAVIPPDKKEEAQAPAMHICLLDTKTGDAEGQDGNAGADSEKLSAGEQEAVFTVQQIHNLVNEQRVCEYKDIAVLLRSTSKQRFYEKYLREAGIPYATENIVGFFTDAPVNDMLHLLRLAVYPGDLLSYAAVLASPFAGLSPKGCAACIADYEKQLEQQKKSLPFDSGIAAALCDADRAQYEAGGNAYRRLRRIIEDEPLTNIVSFLWYDLGYRYETIWSSKTLLYREMYDYLYELARQAEGRGKTPAEFADSLYALRQEETRVDNMEIPLDRPPAVTIMTIHKSKGLQFPVVFLCGTASRSGGWQGTDCITRTADGLMILKPPVPPELSHIPDIKCDYFIKEAAALERSKEEAELRRLFYVAATRAEKQLYITGSLALKMTGPEKLEKALVDYVKAKREEQLKKDPGNGGLKLPVSGTDSALHNNTFTGLYLPVIADILTLPSGALRQNARDLFTLHAIPGCGRGEAADIIAKLNRNTQDSPVSKILAQDRALPFYTAAPLIPMPAPVSNRRTPSNFRLPSPIIYEQNTGTPMIAFPEADAVIQYFTERTPEGAEPAFSAAGFGTAAHAYAESALSGLPVRIPPHITAALTPAQFKIISEAALKMTDLFLESELGKAAQNAQWRRSEYGFRSRLKLRSGEAVFIDGQIDLLFEKDRILHIVDFKTDSDMDPNRHIAQLACYRNAALQLHSAQEYRCWLYYLRFAQAVDITDQAAACILEDCISI